MSFKKRHQIKSKVAKNLAREIANLLGINVDFSGHTVEMAQTDEFKLILVDSKVIFFDIDGYYFFTVRGILEYKVEKMSVTVDMGAVKFVTSGADIMVPGIVDCDPDIAVGDTVWIKDEKNGQPLAIGQALMDAAQIKNSSGGKAIKNIHYVGDSLWQLV